jgi:hypothetical protein
MQNRLIKQREMKALMRIHDYIFIQLVMDYSYRQYFHFLSVEICIHFF